MPNPLIDHIAKVASVHVEDEEALLRFFKAVHVRKKETLQEADNISASLFFVVKGCLRMFFMDEKGVQHTTQFAIENWWLTDFLAFHSQRTTEFYIQAVEDSDVLMISQTSFEQLVTEFPQLERYFRIIYQRGYGASQVRTKHNHNLSREGLYNQFTASFPDFIQRIPQYLLASYLGFTPEYLSELRKKRS